MPKTRITGYQPNKSKRITVLNVSGDTHRKVKALARSMGVPQGHLTDELLSRCVENITAGDVKRFKEARKEATLDLLDSIM